MKVIALSVMLGLCPNAHIVRGYDGTQATSDQAQIWADYEELAGYSRAVQKFIILHECGHTKGLGAETSADAYAFRHMKVTKEMIDEICRVLKTSPADAPRCDNLRKLNESNR